MNANVNEKYALAVFRLKVIKKPMPKEDEVRVNVQAVPINNRGRLKQTAICNRMQKKEKSPLP